MYDQLPPPAPTATPPAEQRVPLLQRKVPKRITVSSLLTVCIFASLMIAFTLSLPSGFGTVAPGPVVRLTGAPVGSAVVDTGATSRGWLAFTTVSVDELNYFETLTARLDGKALVRLTARSSDAPALAQMESSKEIAAALALMSTGANAPDPIGVLVLDVVEDSPAAAAGVRSGDVIIRANGTDISVPSDLRTVISVSTSVLLDIRRNQSELSITTAPEQERIGVEVVPSYAESLGALMNVDTAAVGGPSAGLMLTLAYIDALSPGDLTAGLQVAGTGSIDPLGFVGDIAGLQYKVTAAATAGAEVFFLPKTQEARITEPTPSMNLVAVETFVDALRYLCDAGATDEVCDEVRQ